MRCVLVPKGSARMAWYAAYKMISAWTHTLGAQRLRSETQLGRGQGDANTRDKNEQCLKWHTGTAQNLKSWRLQICHPVDCA